MVTITTTSYERYLPQTSAIIFFFILQEKLFHLQVFYKLTGTRL